MLEYQKVGSREVSSRQLQPLGFILTAEKFFYLIKMQFAVYRTIKPKLFSKTFNFSNEV